MAEDDKDPSFEVITFSGSPTHVSEKIPFEPSGKNFVASPHDFKELTDKPVLGRYTLTHLVGKGGMAEVFLAKQDGPAGFQKTVIVKRIRKALLSEQKFVDMFLREARIAARLNHANVVQIFELGEQDGEYFMAMEFLDGITLHRAARRSWAMERSMPMEVVLKCIADSALGLHHAHTLRGSDGRPAPLVHRDISPDNLLLSRDGVTKVLDFGIAKDALDAADDLVTKTGEIKGKVPYMSPEQIRGERLDGRSDLWSLGVTAYWLLTGRRPFDGGSDHMTIDRVLRSDPPPLREVNPLVPPEVNRLVLSLLEKDPKQRLATGQELHSQLVQILGPAAGGGATASFAEEMMASPNVESNLPPGQLITVVAARPVTAWLQRVQATSGTHYENMLPEPTPTSSGGTRFPVSPEPSTTSKTGGLEALRDEVMPQRRGPVYAGAGLAAVAAIALVGSLWSASDPPRDDVEPLPVSEPQPRPVVAPADDGETAERAAQAAAKKATPTDTPPAPVGEEENGAGTAEPSAPAAAPASEPDLPTPTPPSKKHSRAKDVTLMAVTAPPGIVWSDERGRKIGGGSTTLRVPAGQTSVTAYDPARAVKTSVPVAERANYANLPKGRVTFRVRPWAKVYLGKAVVGTTPMDTLTVTAGTYQVTLEQNEKKVKKSLVVKPGGHTVLKVDMKDE